MANEILLSYNLSLTNGSLKRSAVSGNVQMDQATARAYGDVQAIGTSAETLAKGSIGTVGVCEFQNLDATNFVEIGFDDTGFKSVIKLKAGERFVVRLSTSAPQAKADTASVELAYTMYED